MAKSVPTVKPNEDTSSSLSLNIGDKVPFQQWPRAVKQLSQRVGLITRTTLEGDVVIEALGAPAP